MDKHEQLQNEYMEAQERLFKNHPELGDPFWWDHGEGKDDGKMPDSFRKIVDKNYEKAQEALKDENK